MMTMVLMRSREHICSINLWNAIWAAMHAWYIKASKSHYYYYYYYCCCCYCYFSNL